ncbi:Segregation and condensation protein B [hydrothermal vent metagenome]|uniref:Segregation and condensation protein B n=1 Tax=hydrothermal vent metagenome TaxID=652676 RepID=A0A3B0S463_9ZZZZ
MADENNRKETLTEDESLFVHETDEIGRDTRAVEATLFASEEPMTIADIKLYVGEEVDIRQALTDLQKDYEHRGIVLLKTGDRWHFQTAHDLSHLLRRERAELRKLSRAGMETLAIIAYHEPVSRAEIEAIRGVQVAKGTLDVLMETGWVRPAGRREVPGRPLIYATTAEFLTHFGLQSRKDLPGIDDLKAAGLLDPVDLAMEKMELEAAEEREAELASGEDEIQEIDTNIAVSLENQTESA